MDEKKAIQKDKLRAAPLIKLNVGDLIEQTNARGERTSRPRPFVGSIRTMKSSLRPSPPRHAVQLDASAVVGVERARLDARDGEALAREELVEAAAHLLHARRGAVAVRHEDERAPAAAQRSERGHERGPYLDVDAVDAVAAEDEVGRPRQAARL